jgi:hypothetical protein
LGTEESHKNFILIISSISLKKCKIRKSDIPISKWGASVNIVLFFKSPINKNDV